MDDTKKNALAELAERLKSKIEHHGYVFESHRKDDIAAQRIVAELARIEVYHNPYTGDDHWPTNESAYNAVVACGKIAAGG